VPGPGHRSGTEEPKSKVFDGRFRSGVDRAVKPLGSALRRTGLSPDHLTAFGLLVAVPTAWAIATGRLGLGLGLLIGSAVSDLLDGALAKASGRSSVRGAFFDSVTDRVSDTLVLGGFAWYLMDHHSGHVALLPMAILGASLLVSYERAKAEALGFEAKGGLMERAERVVVLCAALAFSFLMLPLLWLMLALTSLTALQRFARVWTQATDAGQGPPPSERPIFARRASYFHDAPRSGEPIAVAARWRAWREANGWVPRADRPPLWARYGDGARQGSAAARWHERRQARISRLSRAAGDDGDSGPARRGGSRRP
jgi:CDP-diacylglycerol--glycerol-3-phosphate 3-phosphatidyltransferase